MVKDGVRYMRFRCAAQLAGSHQHGPERSTQAPRLHALISGAPLTPHYQGIWEGAYPTFLPRRREKVGMTPFCQDLVAAKTNEVLGNKPEVLLGCEMQ